jgi:hypothetical protein
MVAELKKVMQKVEQLNSELQKSIAKIITMNWSGKTL